MAIPTLLALAFFALPTPVASAACSPSQVSCICDTLGSDCSNCGTNVHCFQCDLTQVCCSVQLPCLECTYLQDCGPCNSECQILQDLQSFELTPSNEQVTSDPDGSYTVSFDLCDGNGQCTPFSETTPATQPTLGVVEAFVRQYEQLPSHEQVVSNPDGSYTAGFDLCNGNGDCTHHEATTPPVGTIVPPNGTCFEYKPEAFTNACLTTSPTPEAVPVPTPQVGSQTVTVPFPTAGVTFVEKCILGPECVFVPEPSVGTTPTPETVPDATIVWTDVPVGVPTPGGYVEATELCGDVSTCRLTL